MNLELQTRKELDLLVRDVKRLSAAFRLFSVIVYILFCIYKTVIKSGYLAFNIVLLCISAVYLGVAIFFTVNGERSDTEKKINAVSARVYHYVRLAALAFSAVLAVLGILTAKEHVTVLSVLLAVFLPVCTVLQLVLDVGVHYLTKRIERFKAALSQDMETLKRDAREIALEIVKNIVFSRKEKRPEAAEEEEQGFVVVGSDELKSLRSMKKVENGGKERGRKFFSFFRRKREKREESAAADGTKGAEGEEKRQN